MKSVSIALIACFIAGCASTSLTETQEIASNIANESSTRTGCSSGKVAYCVTRATRIQAAQQADSCGCQTADPISLRSR